MDKENDLQILLISVYILFYLIITYKPIKTYNLMDDSYNNGNVMITNIKDYKELLKQKIKYINENKNILNSANEEILNIIKNQFESNLDISKMIVSSTLIPG